MDEYRKELEQQRLDDEQEVFEDNMARWAALKQQFDEDAMAEAAAGL